MSDAGADAGAGDAAAVAAAREASADASDRQIGQVVGLLAVLPPLLLVLGVLPFVPAGTWMRTLDLMLLFALLAVALNVVFGHTDQLFLFVGGLAGVGAYTAALGADALGVSAWLTLPLAVGLCGAIGALVSWVSARRRFTVILIAILTLTLQLAITEFFVGARSVTGGSTGFAFAGLGLDAVGDLVGVSRNVVLYYLLLAVLAGVLAFYVRLVDSRYGLAFAAIREDEVAAEAVGIDVVRYKTVAGFLAAALVGVVGVMFAQYNQYVSPSTFTFLEVDVVVLIMLIIGGLRTTFGPVVGAAVVTVIDEVLVEVLGAATQWRTAIFGALLVVLFLYFRSGVVPVARGYLGAPPEPGHERSGPAGESGGDASGSGDRGS